MATTSYGSITIVDITDIGEFSVYPKCNLPTTIIYSPDNGNYTPDWNTSNLQITPVAYYAGQQVSSNLTWVWTRQEGYNTATSISSGNGESVSTDGYGKLTVSQNQFGSGTTYSQLTYIVTATYSDSTLGRDLVAEGQITFSKVAQGTSAKTARITGNNIFKYNKNGAIVGDSSISLEGTVTGCRISGWQYYTGSAWSSYPNSGTGTTLTVNESDSTFVNDCVRIKLVTNETDVFDEFSIYKLRDGAAGTTLINAVLTNEDQMIAASYSGVPISYNGATSRVKVMRGGEDITSTASISITSDNGIGYTSAKTSNNYNSNDTVTVTSMDSALTAGNIYFTCTGYASRQDLNSNTYVSNRYYTLNNGVYTLASGSYNGTTSYYEYYNLPQTFSLIKVQAGADASSFNIYNLNLDTLVLNQNTSGVFTPSTFTASATKITVTPESADTSAFSGKFRITESYSNNADDAIRYTSTNPEAACTSAPTATSVNKILVELLDSGGSTTLDKQTILVTSDGAQGAQGSDGAPGAPGADAINIILGNEAQVFPCNNSNYPLDAITVTIPYAAYKGTTRVAASISNPPSLLGISPHSDSQAATSTNDGLLKYIIPTSTQITNTNGTLSLTFSCQGQNFTKVFSWARSSSAKDGVTMLLYTPEGTLFENGATPSQLTITGYLQSGSTNITSSASWYWEKYNGGSYSAVSTSTASNAYAVGQTLTVKPSAVDGYASFKAVASYDNNNYIQYISLIDKSDPLQISVHSTVGTQLVNGQGDGALYVRVTRNGIEIDPIGSNVATGSAAPSAGYGTNGDNFIVLNSTNRTATLYKKTGGAWAGVSSFAATYEWTFRDANNSPITDGTTLASKFGSAYSSNKVTGKCLFIDKTTIDNKITADVKVTMV